MGQHPANCAPKDARRSPIVEGAALGICIRALAQKLHVSGVVTHKTP